MLLVQQLVILPGDLRAIHSKNTVIEDVEYDVDKITDSDFSKAAMRVFDKIYIGRDGALLSSSSLT